MSRNEAKRDSIAPDLSSVYWKEFPVLATKPQPCFRTLPHWMTTDDLLPFQTFSNDSKLGLLWRQCTVNRVVHGQRKQGVCLRQDARQRGSTMVDDKERGSSGGGVATFQTELTRDQ